MVVCTTARRRRTHDYDCLPVQAGADYRLIGQLGTRGISHPGGALFRRGVLVRSVEWDTLAHSHFGLRASPMNVGCAGYVANGSAVASTTSARGRVTSWLAVSFLSCLVRRDKYAPLACPRWFYQSLTIRISGLTNCPCRCPREPKPVEDALRRRSAVLVKQRFKRSVRVHSR